MNVQHTHPRHRYYGRNGDEIQKHVYGSGKDVLTATGEFHDWSLHLPFDRIHGRTDLSDKLVIVSRSDFGSIEAGMRLIMLPRREYKKVTVFFPEQLRAGATIMALCAHEVVITSQSVLGYNDLHSGAWMIQSQTPFEMGYQQTYHFLLDLMPASEEALRVLLKTARTPSGAERIMQALGLSQHGRDVPVRDWAREFEIPVQLADPWYQRLADLCIEPGQQVVDFESEFYSAKTPSLIGPPFAASADIPAEAR